MICRAGGGSLSPHPRVFRPLSDMKAGEQSGSVCVWSPSARRKRRKSARNTCVSWKASCFASSSRPQRHRLRRKQLTCRTTYFNTINFRSLLCSYQSHHSPSRRFFAPTRRLSRSSCCTYLRRQNASPPTFRGLIVTQVLLLQWEAASAEEPISGPHSGTQPWQVLGESWEEKWRCAGKGL